MLKENYIMWVVEPLYSLNFIDLFIILKNKCIDAWILTNF